MSLNNRCVILQDILPIVDPILQGVSFGGNDISPADAAASAWVQRFASVMQDPSLPLEAVFIADSFWRDLVALSSNFRTLGGIDKIRSFLSSNIPKNRPFNFHFVPDARIQRITPSLHILQGRITFETRVGYCSGVFTLVRRNEGEAWNGWTMVATIEKLKGFGDTFEDPNIIRPSPSSIHQFDLSQSSNMDVIIIGGGQAGLATAARLTRLGLRTLIVERDSRIGNSWRSRYKTLKCNTPKSFSECIVSLFTLARNAKGSYSHVKATCLLLPFHQIGLCFLKATRWPITSSDILI